ncbi:MAG: metallophosphoesterase family protein [Armatimonadota bacterium]
MNPIRIMHFADVHFGVETYGRLDPETGLSTRLADFVSALNAGIDKALSMGVHAALFAGDAYKNRDPNQTHQREFASCIRRLSDAGIPVVMVTGNHDVPNAKGRASSVEIYRTLGVTNVHIINIPEVLRIETSAGPLQVAGMPYLIRSHVLSRDECKTKSISEVTDLLVEKYGAYINDYLAPKVDPAVPAVLLGHFWIKNAKVSGQGGYLNVAEPEVLVSTVANPAFDYVAMGHIHKFQDLNKRRHPAVVYSGSMERIDWAEREEKGFVLADVWRGGAEYVFTPVPARPFVEIAVEADSTESVLRAIEQENIEGAIVKLVYRTSEDAEVAEDAVRAALAPAHMVVAVVREVKRETRARNRLVTESLDAFSALEMYIETRNLDKSLLEYARPLVVDLETRI